MVDVNKWLISEVMAYKYEKIFTIHTQCVSYSLVTEYRCSIRPFIRKNMVTGFIKFQKAKVTV